MTRRAIDPELLPAIELLRSMPPIPMRPEEVGPSQEKALELIAQFESVRPRSEAVVSEDHHVVAQDGASLLVRTYRPRNARGPLPVVYWIHGGGFIGGSVTGDNGYCEGLVVGTGAAVVSIEYRLAQDHPFPGIFEDCMSGLVWLTEHADSLGLDGMRIAVGGASAGGGLAAATVLGARDRGVPGIVFQYLMYPMLDDRAITPSSAEVHGLPTWGSVSNANAWSIMLAGLGDEAEVPYYAAPARCSDLSGLPPTLLQTGEVDVFRDEDIDYAVRLLRAGVPTELHVYPGVFHGWELVAPGAESSRRAYLERDRAIASALGTTPLD